MIKNFIKIIAVASAVAFPAVKVQKANEPLKGYQIYEGQYCSEVLVGDIDHNYNMPFGYHILANFSDGEKSFFIAIGINENETVEMSYIDGADTGLIDWERSGLHQTGEWRYIFDKSYFCLYFKKPLKATMISDYTKQYLSYTSPAREFAGGYDGFIPNFYYTAISVNPEYISKLKDTDKPVTGILWTSGDVSNLKIVNNNFIIHHYYVVASKEEAEKIYSVYLMAFAKSSDGNKSQDFLITELGYIDFSSNVRRFTGMYFPSAIPTLSVSVDYKEVIHSLGAYGLTESVMNYQEGYKDGQGNPTFKSFIVSAFEACSAFFSLPVLGEHITIGTLIGSFVGLGALFLLIKLFR